MKTKRLLFFIFCKTALLMAQVGQATFSTDDLENRTNSIDQESAEFFSERACPDTGKRGGDQVAKSEEESKKETSPLMMFGGWDYNNGYGHNNNNADRRRFRNSRWFDDDDDDDDRNRRGGSSSFARNNAVAEQEAPDFTQHVLSWRLSSIKEQLPGASSAGAVALLYDSRSTYYEQFLPLILEEARAAIEKGLSEQNKNGAFLVRIVNDVREPNVRGNPWIMNLSGVIPRDQEHSPNMNVLLLQHKSGMKFLVLANENTDKNEIKAKFLLSRATVAEKRDLFNVGAEWNATYVTSLVTHKRMYEACDKKTKPDCLTRIVKARIHTPVEHHDPEVGELIKNLNHSQQRAIQSFIAAPEHSTTLLQGPPGTGKTTTIVGLLRVLCRQSQRALVCAPSNKAVQVLAERFLKDHPDIPVILVGVESKISDQLRPIFLHTWRADLLKRLPNLNELSSLLHRPDEEPLTSNSASAQKPPKKVTSWKFHHKKFLTLLQQAKDGIPFVGSQLKKYGFYTKDNFVIAFHQYLDPLIEKTTEDNFVIAFHQYLDPLIEKTKNFNFAQENAFEMFKEHIQSEFEGLKKIHGQALGLSVFKEDAETVEKKLLQQSKIVFATLSVTGRRSIATLPEDVMPKTLIVDEAGQSVEAETLIAFQHQPNKVLLVGDTKQLPATVMSPLAKEKDYDRSMMERLEQAKQPKLMLETQYRMDPEICAWPSNRYYGGHLQTADHLLSNPNISSGLTQPIAFYDISSGREDRGGTSRFNEKEADYVLQAIRKIRETDQESRIGVITFYAAQVEAIKEMLQRLDQNIKQKVSVDTVDGFQGDEREIIILSSVCANNKKDIGFLNDPRRLNVAITRAKQTLIVLGHARTLESRASDIKTMITDLRARGKFFTEQQLNQFLGNEQKPAGSRKQQANNNNNKNTAVASTAAVQQEVQKKKGKNVSRQDSVQNTTAKTDELASAITSKLERIRNPEADYTDDDMKDLGEMLLPTNVHYIVPAVAAVPTALSQALDAFIQDPEKQQAVITIHNENHFTGVLIRKDQSNQFTITHFDPVGFAENGQLLHKIPDSIFRILSEKFPAASINNANSKIQSYTVIESGKKKTILIDNHHCGPFVLYVMTELAKGTVRSNPSKIKKFQLKANEQRWIDIPALDQNQSDAFGKLIRDYHARLLSGEQIENGNAQISILKNLIDQSQSNSSSSSSANPLNTMSDLSNALPTPPPLQKKNKSKK